MIDNNVITINTNEIPNEGIAIWLSDLFKNEISTGVSNAEVWGDQDTTKDEKEYNKIMIHAYNEVQKYWGKYGEYIEEK